jgi:hypothetical protein
MDALTALKAVLLHPMNVIMREAKVPQQYHCRSTCYTCDTQNRINLETKDGIKVENN